MRDVVASDLVCVCARAHSQRLLRILGFDLICKNSEVQLARGIQLEFLFAIKQWQTLSTQVI